MTKLGLPWIFQSTATNGKQASVLHLDEVKQLLTNRQVKQMRGVQCPFGALSASPMTLVYHLIDLSDMPSDCRHEVKQDVVQRKEWVGHYGSSYARLGERYVHHGAND